MADEIHCKATREDGEPCQAPARFVDPSTGYCNAHAEGAREWLSEIGRRGAEATAKKLRGKGLDNADLPPLESHAAAERWLETVGRAVATGGLSQSAGNTVIRAVREWLRAHEAGAVSERLDALMRALAEWRRTGDAAPVLRLVEGGGE